MPKAYDAQAVDLKFIPSPLIKGLEADHIILPGMHTVGLGFPSRVEDDPVLQLAMPSDDAYVHAEERRLFYVAMTRARFSCRSHHSRSKGVIIPPRTGERSQTRN